MVYDTRGHVSELLAKCIKQGALEQELTADDRSRMIEFLRQQGDLYPDFQYKGSTEVTEIRHTSSGVRIKHTK